MGRRLGVGTGQSAQQECGFVSTAFRRFCWFAGVTQDVCVRNLGKRLLGTILYLTGSHTLCLRRW
jgi:hypothetical protein